MSRVRTHVIALLVLILALSLPLAALAAGPGSSDRGEGGRAIAREASGREIPVAPVTVPVTPRPVETPVTDPDAPVPPLPAQDGRPEWAGKPEWADKPDGVPRSSEETGKPEWAGKPDGVPRSSEETGKPEWAAETDAAGDSAETTGVARARLQIERNIERAESKVEEGLMRHVPPGLARALEALMAWLGLAPEPVPADGS